MVAFSCLVYAQNEELCARSEVELTLAIGSHRRPDTKIWSTQKNDDRVDGENTILVSGKLEQRESIIVA